MRATVTTIFVLVLALPVRVFAQAGDTPPADKKPVVKPAADTGNYALIARNDLMYGGGFSLATFAVAQLDRKVAQKLQDSLRIPSLFTTRSANTFNTIGVPGASLTSEISSRWPHAARYAAPPLFATATLVAWARVQSNQHWVSDVFMGAGLGTLIGIKTVRFNHKHPHNRLDRIFLAASPAIVSDGRGSSAFALIWTAHPGLLLGR